MHTVLQALADVNRQRFEVSMNPKLLLLGFSALMLLPFFWFLSMGRGTFRTPVTRTTGLKLGALALLSGLLLGMWNGVKGTYDPAHWVAGAVIALASMALYESARRVIKDRGFCLALSGEVPQSVCVEGPYRFVRHPVYGSYILAFLAMLIAFPNAVGATLFAINVLFFGYAAAAEERVLAGSPLASRYSAYKNSAGMFLPRLRPGGPRHP
jgi:protein-S-isoprenylcysteine O-methyltransferase Ste14